MMMTDNVFNSDGRCNSTAFNCVRISSYNCRGFNSTKSLYINSLLSQCDFLCIQEHWLNDHDLFKLNDINTNFLSTGISGFDDKSILNGRPYGGCGILWRANVDGRVSIMKVNSRRVCAIRIEFTNYKLLIVTVYMPHQGILNYFDVLQEQIAVIDHLISCNIDCHVAICGDYNIDFSRSSTYSSAIHTFSDFYRQAGLQLADDHPTYSVDYSYNFAMQRFSTLDHFLLSGALFEACMECTVHHDGDNLSDHDPIFLKLNMSLSVLHTNNVPYKQGISWARASEEDIAQYRNKLAHLLNNIDVPLTAINCRDIRCCDLSHQQSINQYCADISNACLKASYSSIPRTKNKNSDKNRIPGWSEHVEPLRKKSVLWHNMWHEAGKPHSGTIADIMRRTRAAYHHAVRKVKKGECDIRKQKFAECVLENRTRDFWTEIKKMNGTLRSRGCAATVDGLSSSEQIATLFADKYQHLYNTVPYDVDEMNDIRLELETMVGSEYCDEHFIVREDEIANAISDLKFNKNDGNTGLSTNHLKYACREIDCHLSMLFSSILIHGYASADLLRGTTIPIPKGRNSNLTTSDNYRGITLSSIFLRIFDLIVLSRYRDCLSTCDLQFGFKKKCSTNICSWLLKETASYYVNNDSSVFCTLLDASKAFDKIEYCLLFKELIKRKLPAVIIRMLLNIYINQEIRVQWNNCHSNWFPVCNGVKQGAIISPILFCIYFDNLLIELKSKGIGCHIGQMFIGALAYADDVALLAPTASALRQMLVVCENYAAKYKVTFNASKSKCILIGNKRRTIGSRPEFSLNGDVIDYVDSWSHLGHIINDKLTDTDDILNRRSTMFGQINRVICNFSSIDFGLKCKLFNTFCNSNYGCEIWELESRKIAEYCAGWRRGLRRFLDLPYDFSTKLLHVLSRSVPIFDIICCRALNFIVKCLNSQSELISSVSRFCLSAAGSSSFFGRNIVFLSKWADIPIHKLLLNNINHAFLGRKFQQSTDQVDNSLAFSAYEIISLKEGILKIEGQTWDRASLQACLQAISDSTSHRQ